MNNKAEIKMSTYMIALVIAGAFLSVFAGWIISFQSYYGVNIDETYSGVYQNMTGINTEIAKEYANPTKADIEAQIGTETEDEGYFKGLDRAWEAVKTPFKLVSLTGNLINALSEDLNLPSWVSWQGLVTTILTIAFIFLVISAIMKYRM